jgi:hypothetical protein
LRLSKASFACAAAAALLTACASASKDPDKCAVACLSDGTTLVRCDGWGDREMVIRACAANRPTIEQRAQR